jgi:cytochrome c-type biogenesis protein CcmH
MRSLGLGVLLVLLPSAAVAAAPVSEDQVTAIARQLRCVVCQNLSVADSPSEMARQMRDLIRERLTHGESPEQVVAYFVERYGEWVLLAPRPRGFTLLVWLAPAAALLAGFAVVLRMASRWSRRPSEPAEAPSPEERERVRAELERLTD